MAKDEQAKQATGGAMEVEERRQEEEEEEDDVFSRPLKRKKRKNAPKPTKRLKIVLKTPPVVEAEAVTKEAAAHADKPLSEAFQIQKQDVFDPEELEELEEELELELEDSLSFFQETHEDQDPAYKKYQQQLAEEERQKKLKALDEADELGRKEIEAVIAQQCKEKKAATERSLEKYKQRAIDTEKLNTNRMQQIYRQKTASVMSKISDGIKILQRRHQKELQSELQLHQQRASQRRLTEAMANSEWKTISQQIQSRQHHSLSNFNARGEELKKKTEAEYRREMEKIQKDYQTRLAEVESSRQKLFAKLHLQSQQLQQRYLKRHSQRIMKEKEELLAQDLTATDATSTTSTSPTRHNPREIAKSTMEERAELKPPEPIRCIQPWAKELPTVSGASVRHKHRKGVMNQTVRQLQLEIHNEGLWISTALPSEKNKDDKNSVDNNYEFVPWGAKAHAILESVVCGEIPVGLERFVERHPNATEILALQGGQVRCMLSDLRTSEETASMQRALAKKELEEEMLKDLESNVNEMNKASTEAEKAVSEATRKEKDQEAAVVAAVEDMKNAVRIQEEFKTKFKDFLGPDGNPISTVNPKDRQDLQKAIQRYKNNHETAIKQEKVAKDALEETKMRLKKLGEIVKSAQKQYNIAVNLLKKRQVMYMATKGSGRGKMSKQEEQAADAEYASVRVNDVVGALKKTAEMRRKQADQKKSMSFGSAWIQALPGLPMSLKKALWHKMHRRRQPVMLRPTEEALLNELRSTITSVVAPKLTNMRNNREKVQKIEEEMARAEQLYLLAAHPLAEQELSTVPTSKSGDSWAEPGWRLNLDVPVADTSDLILPCMKTFPVLESNLSEVASAPGRQAASLLRTSHLQCLSSPLSTFAIASSPAETSTSLAQSYTHAEGDPLHISGEAMSLGYKFVPTKPQPAGSKTKAASARGHADSNADATSKKQSTTEASAAHSAPSDKAKARETKKADSKPKPKPKRRSSKKGATSAPAPSPRSQKQKVNIDPMSAVNAAAMSAQYSQFMQQQAQQLHLQQQRQQQQTQRQNQQQGKQQQQSQLPQQQQGQRRSSHHFPPQQHLQYNQQQMAQLRMMQQQQQQQQPPQQGGSPRHQQQIIPNYPPQALQQMQQFYTPLNQPNPMAQMQMQAQQGSSQPQQPPLPRQQQPMRQQSPQVMPQQQQATQRSQPPQQRKKGSPNEP